MFCRRRFNLFCPNRAGTGDGAGSVSLNDTGPREARRSGRIRVSPGYRLSMPGPSIHNLQYAWRSRVEYAICRFCHETMLTPPYVKPKSMSSLDEVSSVLVDTKERSSTSQILY